MNIEPKHTKDGSQPPPSKRALILSFAFHIAVLLLIIFGLPHWKTDPELVEPVPVELIANIGELTTTNKQPVDAPKPKEPKEEPPKKTEEQKKPPEPKKSETPPPPEETLEDAPKPEKIVEKKPPPKKEPPKKEEPKNDFDSLLKDLAPETKQQPNTDEKAKKVTEASPAPNVSRFSSVLSMSEMDALRQQLSQCWSVMAGAADSEDLRVELEVVVNQDRTVASSNVVDQSRYASNPFFRAAADSAMRAMRNPNCNPLNVPPDKYDQWHEMTIVFDPKEMF